VAEGAIPKALQERSDVFVLALNAVLAPEGCKRCAQFIVFSLGRAA
jgi:hypothetical protein